MKVYRDKLENKFEVLYALKNNKWYMYDTWIHILNDNWREIYKGNYKEIEMKISNDTILDEIDLILYKDIIDKLK